jgi:hypothetical protein
VERFRSGLAHQLRGGASPTASTAAEAVERGYYHRALSPWWDTFGAQAILVLQYERCVADPAGQLAATYRFLGLDGGYQPPDLGRPVSVTAGRKPPLDDDARRRLVELYSPDVTALAHAVPGLDLGLWAHFAQVARR